MSFLQKQGFIGERSSEQGRPPFSFSDRRRASEKPRQEQEQKEAKKEKTASTGEDAELLNRPVPRAPRSEDMKRGSF